MSTYREDEKGNTIHSSAIIDGDVSLGYSNFIGPHCYLTGKIIIGNNNRFEAYCSIGTKPEHKSVFKENVYKGLVIGDRNVFREFTTVNCGFSDDTFIGDDCIFLRGSHVGHCTSLGNHVAVHCNVILGGHSIVGEGAYLGLGSILNPRCTIPPYTVIGSNSLVIEKSHLRPFYKYAGSPVREIGYNSVGIERAGLSIDKIFEINKKYGVIDAQDTDFLPRI